MKYRKRPIEVHAILFDFEDWVENRPLYPMVTDRAFSPMINPYPVIHTLEGYMHVSDGDWIIKGVEGEYYPCKPEIFKKTYEEVTE